MAEAGVDVIPPELQHLLERMVKSVLVCRPKHGISYFAEYLEAELNRRTLTELQNVKLKAMLTMLDGEEGQERRPWESRKPARHPPPRARPRSPVRRKPPAAPVRPYAQGYVCTELCPFHKYCTDAVRPDGEVFQGEPCPTHEPYVDPTRCGRMPEYFRVRIQQQRYLARRKKAREPRTRPPPDEGPPAEPPQDPPPPAEDDIDQLALLKEINDAGIACIAAGENPCICKEGDAPWAGEGAHGTMYSRRRSHPLEVDDKAVQIDSNTDLMERGDIGYLPGEEEPETELASGEERPSAYPTADAPPGEDRGKREMPGEGKIPPFDEAYGGFMGDFGADTEEMEHAAAFPQRDRMAELDYVRDFSGSWEAGADESEQPSRYPKRDLPREVDGRALEKPDHEPTPPWVPVGQIGKFADVPSFYPMPDLDHSQLEDPIVAQAPTSYPAHYSEAHLVDTSRDTLGREIFIKPERVTGEETEEESVHPAGDHPDDDGETEDASPYPGADGDVQEGADDEDSVAAYPSGDHRVGEGTDDVEEESTYPAGDHGGHGRGHGADDVEEESAYPSGDHGGGHGEDDAEEEATYPGKDGEKDGDDAEEESHYPTGDGGGEGDQKEE